MIGKGFVFIRLCRAFPTRTRAPRQRAGEGPRLRRRAAADGPQRDRSDARIPRRGRTSEGAEPSLEHHRPRLN